MSKAQCRKLVTFVYAKYVIGDDDVMAMGLAERKEKMLNRQKYMLDNKLDRQVAGEVRAAKRQKKAADELAAGFLEKSSSSESF